MDGSLCVMTYRTLPSSIPPTLPPPPFSHLRFWKWIFFHHARGAMIGCNGKRKCEDGELEAGGVGHCTDVERKEEAENEKRTRQKEDKGSGLKRGGFWHCTDVERKWQTENEKRTRKKIRGWLLHFGRGWIYFHHARGAMVGCDGK